MWIFYYITTPTPTPTLDALSELRTLEHLRATNCTIDHLPMNIPNIIELDLCNNKLISFDGIKSVNTSTQVTSYFIILSFNNNQISMIPTNIK